MRVSLLFYHFHFNHVSTTLKFSCHTDPFESASCPINHSFHKTSLAMNYLDSIHNFYSPGYMHLRDYFMIK